MSDYSIIAGSPRHIKPMAAQLRAAACVTLQGFGFNPREALRRAFVVSSYCRTAMKGGKPIAMWGVKTGLLADKGMVWLVLSNEVTHMPVAVVREARAELAKVMETLDEVAITVLPDDEAAIRFAVAMGFHDREEGLSRKDLTRQIMTDPKFKVPIGDSYVVALGYHPGIAH